MPSIEQQHRRFNHQTQWTAQVREYLFEKASLGPGDRVIEVGCGTGAVLQRLPETTLNFGLDISPAFLAHASVLCPQVPLTCGDAHQLPYPSGSFDAVCCHFLLLWVADPAAVLREMTRIGKPGAAVIILAEPDYGGRIDHPAELVSLGKAQSESLRTQGADPLLGRRLPGLMGAAGLEDIEIGIISSQWQPPLSPEELENERKTLIADLENILPAEELEDYLAIDHKAWEEGERVLFVPTFYAIGQVK